MARLGFRPVGRPVALPSLWRHPAGLCVALEDTGPEPFRAYASPVPSRAAAATNDYGRVLTFRSAPRAAFHILKGAKT